MSLKMKPRKSTITRWPRFPTLPLFLIFSKLKKKIVFRVVLMSSVFSLLLFINYDATRPTSISITDNHRTTKSFFVRNYKFIDDFLELIGHYGNGANGTDANTVLQLDGIQELLHQIKPHMILDKKLVTTVLSLEKVFKIQRKVTAVNCNRLFKGDKNEIEKAKTLVEDEPTQDDQIEDEQYMNMTHNCTSFIENRGYIMNPLTKIEEEFPIAFSILLFKDVWQFERLLRAVYMPQNFYCIHVDSKADSKVLNSVKAIANCFDNVFMASKQFKVKWGRISVLEPELTCMGDLWNKSKIWKYFINLTGQEFPLRTNFELVQILKAYNGANDMESTIKRANKDRWVDAGNPPHGITPVKGSVHIVASRGYVDFVLHDQRAADFLNWTRKTGVPDETFFSSMNHNPFLNVPGSYKGEPETDSVIKPFVTRFKNWGAGIYNWKCTGQRVRMICVFGIGDLHILSTRKELFANKFYWDFEHFTLDCMEELHFNHTRDEYLGKLVFDPRWYAELGFVRNKVE